MKDRRLVSLERVLSRRETFERRLNRALLVLRDEHRVLEGALAECHSAAGRQTQVLVEQNSKLDEMMGQPFRPDAFLRLREHQAAMAQRHAMLQNEVSSAAAQVDNKQREIDLARARIVQNRARIDIYGQRRDKLRREIEAAMEDAQDEEASESRRPGPRPF
jgi:chromosome segregation ATPase